MNRAKLQLLKDALAQSSDSLLKVGLMKSDFAVTEQRSTQRQGCLSFSCAGRLFYYCSSLAQTASELFATGNTVLPRMIFSRSSSSR